MPKTRNFSLLLILGVIVSLMLVGCSGSEGSSEQTESEGNDQDEQASEEPIEIEMLYQAGGVQLPEDDFIKEKLDEALGIDMNLQLESSGDDLTNKINVRASGNDMPDMIQVG